MSLIFSIEEFDYQILSPRYEKDTISLVGECFSKYEKMSINGSLSQRILEEFCTCFLDNYLGRELTIICVHRPSQTVVGTSINNGYNPNGSEMPFIPSDFNPNNEKDYILGMLKFCDQLDEDFFNKFNVDRSLCIHHQIGVVDIKWRKRNIVYYLVLASLKVARSKGLTISIAEATGPQSQSIYLKKLGYTCPLEFRYEDCKLNGIKHFKDLEGNCKLVFKYIRLDIHKI